MLLSRHRHGKEFVRLVRLWCCCGCRLCAVKCARACMCAHTRLLRVIFVCCLLLCSCSNNVVIIHRHPRVTEYNTREYNRRLPVPPDTHHLYSVCLRPLQEMKENKNMTFHHDLLLLPLPHLWLSLISPPPCSFLSFLLLFHYGTFHPHCFFSFFLSNRPTVVK